MANLSPSFDPQPPRPVPAPRSARARRSTVDLTATPVSPPPAKARRTGERPIHKPDCPSPALAVQLLPPSDAEPVSGQAQTVASPPSPLLAPRRDPTPTPNRAAAPSPPHVEHETSTSDTDEAIQNLLRQKAVQALTTLGAVMDDPEASHSAKVSAANAVLGRYLARMGAEPADGDNKIEFIIRE